MKDNQQQDLPRSDYPQFRDLLTEAELIDYLRIREISSAKDYHNVIENLKRMRDLPRFPLCNKNLFPLKAVRAWIDQQTKNDG